MLKKSSTVTFEACVEEGYILFHRLFRDKTDGLIKAYPKDAKTRDGKPFWTGTKRFPQSACFDSANDAHISFVMTYAAIRAEQNYGLEKSDDWSSREYVAKSLGRWNHRLL